MKRDQEKSGALSRCNHVGVYDIRRASNTTRDYCHKNLYVSSIEHRRRCTILV